MGMLFRLIISTCDRDGVWFLRDLTEAIADEEQQGLQFDNVATLCDSQSYTCHTQAHLPVHGDARCGELVLRFNVDGENTAVDANLATPGTGAVDGGQWGFYSGPVVCVPSISGPRQAWPTIAGS